MQVDSLEVVLRRRSMWEACDLGIRLCQAHLRSIYPCYLMAALPIFVLALASMWIADWLPGVLIWCAKPWLDRTILFTLSRALFGAGTTPRELWHARRDIWWTRFFHTWLIRRLSPWRSFTQPVHQLEGLHGAQLRARLNQFRGPHRFAAAMVTQAFALSEYALLLSGGALLLLLTPSTGRFNFDSLPMHLGGAMGGFLGTLWYALAVCIVEPFYVAAGFGMYLNRRVELEAWDIEQEFRRAFAA